MRELTIVEETASNTGMIGVFVIITVGICLLCFLDVLNLKEKQRTLEKLLTKIISIQSNQSRISGKRAASQSLEEDIRRGNMREPRKKKNEYWDMHDLQTDLYNRNAFEKQIKDIPTHNLGILFVGLIGMRRIDDVYGRGAGDQIVEEVAKLLNTEFQDECYRWESDVFCVMLNGMGENILLKKKDAVKQKIEQMKFRVGKGKEITCEVAVGVCCGTKDMTKDAVIENAEKEMLSYRVKNGVFVDAGRIM